MERNLLDEKGPTNLTVCNDRLNDLVSKELPVREQRKTRHDRTVSGGLAVGERRCSLIVPWPWSRHLISWHNSCVLEQNDSVSNAHLYPHCPSIRHIS